MADFIPDNIIQFRRPAPLIRNWHQGESGLATYDQARYSGPVNVGRVTCAEGFAIVRQELSPECEEVDTLEVGAGLVAMMSGSRQRLEWIHGGKSGRMEQEGMICLLPKGARARFVSPFGMPWTLHLHISEDTLRRRFSELGVTMPAELQPRFGIADTRLNELFSFADIHHRYRPIDGRIARGFGEDLCLELISRRLI